MNIDRYSESFMPVSTYQYAANNPILYLDYNGDYITIGINDDDGNKYSVLYENGKTYHYSKDKDGNVVKGDLYDGKDNGFLGQAVKDLNKVSSTKQGGRLVGSLQDSSDGYDISDSGRSSSNSFNPNNNSIVYSQEDSGFHDGVSFGDSYIKLGHELAHAYDKDRGFDVSGLNNLGIAKSEVNATRFENYLRSLNGETNMRLSYGPYIGSKLGGTSADFFKSFILPLGRNKVYRLSNAVSPTDRSNNRVKTDNTRVQSRTRGVTKIYDTKKGKFESN